MRRFIPFLKSPPLVPVIRLQGTIGMGVRSLSDASLAPVIERAFSRGKPAAVALAINSPGGSPAQSSLIAARIRRLADEKSLPVHAFVEDVAASGGYWLATAADQIWADESSILGSIGVISAGFGFPEALARLGVERRVQTAGRSKSLADPFRPQTEEDVARIRALIEPLHQIFIAQVQARRGVRLDATADLFNADIWLGRRAVDLGAGRWNRASEAEDDRALRAEGAACALWPAPRADAAAGAFAGGQRPCGGGRSGALGAIRAIRCWSRSSSSSCLPWRWSA
jgi:signal peptide peptidase SppA